MGDSRIGKCCCSTMPINVMLLGKDTAYKFFLVKTDLTNFEWYRIDATGLAQPTWMGLERDAVSGILHAMYANSTYLYWSKGNNASWTRKTVCNTAYRSGTSSIKPTEANLLVAIVARDSSGNFETRRYRPSYDDYVNENNNVTGFRSDSLVFDSTGKEHATGINSSSQACVFRYTGSTTWAVSTGLVASLDSMIANTIYDDKDYCLYTRYNAYTKVGIWDGSTWSETQLTTSQITNGDILVDANGYVHIAYSKSAGAGYEKVYYVTNTSGSYVESEIQQVSVSAANSMPKIVLYNGYPVICYFNYASGDTRLRVASKPASTWNIIEFTAHDGTIHIGGELLSVCL